VNLIRIGISFILFVAFSTSTCFSQASRSSGREIKIKGIKQKLVEAPDFGTFTKELGTPSAGLIRRWLKIETEFESSPEWADDISLRYYVLMGKGDKAKLFEGELTYVNVARGQSHFSAVFMHPNTVQRYGDGQAGAVAVQLYFENRLVDQASDPKTKQRWWEQFSPVKGYILSPPQTPWSVIAHQRYEALKSTR